ncbi:hypothetical protein BH24ACT3_BH24ACT3_05670 [soil metagenome]
MPRCESGGEQRRSCGRIGSIEAGDGGAVQSHCRTPWASWVAMRATSLRFAGAARSLGHAARAQGFTVPAFRSPPRLAGAERSLRRRADGGATVSVRIQGRPFAAVVADMVEGVVVTNHLTGPAADRARTALWASVEGNELRAA